MGDKDFLAPVKKSFLKGQVKFRRRWVLTMQDIVTFGVCITAINLAIGFLYMIAIDREQTALVRAKQEISLLKQQIESNRRTLDQMAAVSLNYGKIKKPVRLTGEMIVMFNGNQEEVLLNGKK